MDFDIENDVSIDQYQLDSECITMAATYYKYADAAREAKSIASEKADYIKIIMAERNIAIREECANSGAKVTEGIITSKVQSDPQVVQAMKEYREAEATYARLAAMVSSLEIKKSELDNLVKLRCNSVYVENTMKPTTDIQTDIISERNQNNMTPLPKK